MTNLRFDFQREKAQIYLDREEVVLNVGAWDDPAGLGQMGAVNCDIQEKVSPHVLMNVLEPWPFEDDYAGLVVLGDILEHLAWHEIADVLAEAHRVSRAVCITCPEETRPDALVDWREEPPPRNHCTTITRPELEEVMTKLGWRVIEWHKVDYIFVPNGHFVYAERA